MSRERKGFWDYATENPFWAYFTVVAIVEGGVMIGKTIASLIRHRKKYENIYDDDDD